MSMELTKLKWIVFVIDAKHKDHSGCVFSNYKDAREFVANMLDSDNKEKAIIGTFYLEPDYEHMNIQLIETIGFKGDGKTVNQLKFFS